jgi:hypothetical protein
LSLSLSLSPQLTITTARNIVTKLINHNRNIDYPLSKFFTVCPLILLRKSIGIKFGNLLIIKSSSSHGTAVGGSVGVSLPLGTAFAPAIASHLENRTSSKFLDDNGSWLLSWPSSTIYRSDSSLI